MISVLTMTYQRHRILEEAMQSFLEQDYKGECEMVVLNDSENVRYSYNGDERIRIINHPQRFSSLGKKLKFGFEQCRGDFIYRLDDDDLLTPWALSLVSDLIKNDADIYRCHYAYFFLNNIYYFLSDNVNNGNTYKKDFINNIDFPDKTITEDLEITFKRGGKIYTDDRGIYSMIYRWGGDTYHISSLGTEHQDNHSYIFGEIDKRTEEKGVIELNPHFDNDYYSQLPVSR